ncbi:MAG: T9SS type A sorting domain-containing protein [Bacteroidota bacterium]
MKNWLAVIFVFFSIRLFSQNLYLEDFEDNTSGTTVDNGATAWSRDLRNATLGAPDDHFEVRINNGLTIFETVDVDGAPEWLSETIDISAFASVQVFVDYAEVGTLENNDLIRLYYVLDGVRTQFAIFRNDFGNVFQTASSPQISGNTLQVVARIRNNSDDELIAIDNITITGVGSTIFSRQDGDWNDPDSWSLSSFSGPSCGCYPGRSTTAIIGNNNIITVNTDIDVQNLTIRNSGSLVWGGVFEMDVFNNGNIVVESGGILDINGIGSNLTVSGLGSVVFESIILDGDNETFTNNLTTALNINGNASLDGNNVDIINNGSLDIGGDVIFFNFAGLDIVNATFTNNGMINLVGDILAAENTSVFTNNSGATLGLTNILTFFGTSFTLNNSGTVNQAGDISQTDINGIFNNLNSGVWNYAGSTPDADIQLFADNSGNLFRYTGTTQVIITPADAYNTIVIAGTGSKSTLSDLDINGDLIFEESGVLDMTIGSNNLQLAGDWIERGTVSDPFIEGFLNVTLDGSLDQELEPDTLYNLTVNKTGGDVNLVEPLSMLNRLEVNSSTTFNTNNQLTLVSTSDGETNNGSIGTLNTAASVSGDVNVQRFMSGEGRIYRYLASPVTNTTVTSWQDDFPITGTFDDPSSGSIGGIPIRPNSPSLYFYDETATGNIQQGWVNYPGSGTAASNPITVGTGYAGFVREATASTIIDMIGPVYQGDFNFNVSFTDSGSPTDDGWNLLGNPYPSPIDWSAPGWTKVGFADAVYIRDNGNATVASYVSGVGTNGGTGRIATGQAFWVQSVAINPILSISETSKSAQGATFFRRAAERNILRITLWNENERDEAVFRITDNATKSYESDYDARKLKNETFNLSFLTADADLVIHSTDQLSCSDTLMLKIQDAQAGNYYLNFSGIDSFFPHYEVTLVDAYESVYTSVEDSLQYSFSISNNPLSQGGSRFSLIFEKVDDISFKAFASDVCEGDVVSVQIPDSKSEVLYSVYIGDALVDSDFGTDGLLNFDIETTGLIGGLVKIRVVGLAELCSEISFESLVYVELFKVDLAPSPLVLERCGPGEVVFDFVSDYRVNWYLNEVDTTPFLQTDSYSSRDINSVESFYVTFVNEFGCESSRSKVVVNINKQTMASVRLKGLNILETSSTLSKEWYFEDDLIKEGVDQIVMDKPDTFTLKISSLSCSDSVSFLFEKPLDRWFDISEFHPNPVQDDLYLRLTQDGSNFYTVSDVSGKVRITGDFQGLIGEVVRVNTSNLGAGYYFLQVNNQKFRFLKL